MEAFFRSGHVADLILAVLAAEAVLLSLWRRRSGRGPDLPAILALVLPGVALVLALRLALTGAWWGWIGLALTGALAAHLLDLGQRLRR